MHNSQKNPFGLSATAGRGGATSQQPVPTDPRLWTTAEVSEFLGVPVTTLYVWRTRGEGPKAYRVGRHLRYYPTDVRRWLEDCVA